MKKQIKEYIVITIGFLIVAFGSELFLVPNKISGGGVMGIAIVVRSMLGSSFKQLSVGVLMLIMNGVLFIVAFITIGTKFAWKTVYASIGLSVSMWIIEKAAPNGISVTNNLMLATIFGTLISGGGMGIVFNHDASTGGTDIIAKIVNKFLHIDIGKSLLLVDFSITLFSGVELGADIGMYSLLSVLINGFVIDSVIEGFNVCKQVMIISSEGDIINEFIIEKIDRSCTVLEGKGGYTGKKVNILYAVMNRNELIKLREFIKDVDSQAFITVNDVREVLGNGFKDINDE